MKPFGIGAPAAGGAPLVSPVPPPRGQAPAPVSRTATGGGGMFPNIDPQRRYDIAMSMLQQGMAAASQANSPLLSLLAPLAGAGIGGAIENKYGKASSTKNDETMSQLLGAMAGDPKVKGLTDVLNDPSAPDYAKSIAKSQLDKLLNPPKAKTGTAASAYGRAPGNLNALATRLLHNAMDPDGDGGETITPAEQARLDAVAKAGQKTSASTFDYGSSGDAGGDDPLLIDPLGIR